MKTLENYLEDSLNQLLDEALELRKKADTEFDKGKLFGYYETILKLLNQAEAFGISNNLPKRIREFDPENLIK